MRSVFAVMLSMMVAGSAMAGGKKPCEVNYTQEGKFMSGRRFSTWDVVPGVSLATAFKRIQTEGVKAGLQVTASDAKNGMLSFTQPSAGAVLGGGTVNLPWNVVIEAQGKDVKITVTKTTPGGYNTSADFQKASMCGVIDAARNP